MAYGRQIQLTRQIGEHLVAAELGRHVFIAAPFAGNVPLFDMMAADERGYPLPVQVKTISEGSSWQYQASTFLKITIPKQRVLGKKRLLNPDLICSFVALHTNKPTDFYIFLLRDLQKMTFHVYKPNGVVRSNNTTHCCLRPMQLEHFKDNLGLMKEAFKKQRG